MRSLPLSRTSALSLSVILSTLALFATGATFALTGGDSASGTITAASAAITVEGIGTDGALAFTNGASSCPGAILPGEACTETVTVKNVSPVTLVLNPPTHTIDVTDTVPPTGCSNSSTQWLVTLGSLGADGLAPGATTTFTVSVRLQSGASPGCQGESATVTVTVTSST